MEKKAYIKLCPICGSKKFEFFKGNKTNEIASSELYQCNRCNNVFAFPIELPIKQAMKVKEVPLTKEILKDTPQTALIGLGKFEINIYWKILGLAMLIIGFFLIFSASLPIHCYPIENYTECVSNTNPLSFLVNGAALASAGLYLLLESFLLLKNDEPNKRILRIGLVLALLIIIIILGAGHLVIFQWA